MKFSSAKIKSLLSKSSWVIMHISDGAFVIASTIASVGCHYEIFSSALSKRLPTDTNIYEKSWLLKKQCGFCNWS